MSKDSTGTQTQTVGPPEFAVPYIEGGYGQAQSLYNQGGPQYYPNDTFVPFAPQSEQAMAGTMARAQNGSPVMNAATNYATNLMGGGNQFQGGNVNSVTGANNWGAGFDTSQGYGTDYAQRTLNGDFLNGNPWLDQTFDRAVQKSRGALDTQFATAGRNLVGQLPYRTEQVNNLARDIYGGAYEAERGRQQQAMGYMGQMAGLDAQSHNAAQGRLLSANSLDAQMQNSGLDRSLNAWNSANNRGVQAMSFAPQFANQDYIDLAAMQGVGSQVEGQAGQILQSQMDRFNFNQQRPEQALDSYLNRIALNTSNAGQTSTQPIYRNNLMGGLGGAATGAALGQAMGSTNPLWALGGGLAGWLGG